MREQAKKFKKEFQPKVQKELKNQQQKLQIEMERLRHEMQGDWLEL
jgi:hypothetical protein